jgi:hypothetical protein
MSERWFVQEVPKGWSDKSGAPVTAWRVSPIGWEGDEHRARLIAAAPELLDMVDRLAGLALEEGYESDHADAVELLDRAAPSPSEESGE